MLLFGDTWHFLFIFQGSNTIIHIHADALEENYRSWDNVDNECLECIKWFALTCSIQILIFIMIYMIYELCKDV